MIGTYFDDVIDEKLADDYIDEVLLGAVVGTAQDAAASVLDENSLMNNIVNLGKKAGNKLKGLLNSAYEWFGKNPPLEVREVASVEERCAAIVKASYEINVAKLLTKWSSELESKPVYTKYVQTRVKSFMETMKEKWGVLGLDQNNMTGETPKMPFEFTGKLSNDMTNVRGMYNELARKMNIPLNISPSLTGWLAGVGTTVGLSTIYYFLLPVDFIIPGFGTVVTIAAVAVMTLVTLISHDAKDKQIQRIRNELEKSIRSQITEKKSEIRKNVINGTKDKPGLRIVREFYESAFSMAIGHQLNDLEQKYEQKKQLLALDAAERERIAALAKTWREDKIVPLREEVKGIIDEINSIWN